MSAISDGAARRLQPGETPELDELVQLWTGEAQDAFARDVIVATAGAALFVAGAGADLKDAEAMAADLWEGRAR